MFSKIGNSVKKHFHNSAHGIPIDWRSKDKRVILLNEISHQGKVFVIFIFVVVVKVADDVIIQINVGPFSLSNQFSDYFSCLTILSGATANYNRPYFHWVESFD